MAPYKKACVTKFVKSKVVTKNKLSMVKKYNIDNSSICKFVLASQPTHHQSYFLPATLGCTDFSFWPFFMGFTFIAVWLSSRFNAARLPTGRLECSRKPRCSWSDTSIAEVCTELLHCMWNATPICTNPIVHGYYYHDYFPVSCDRKWKIFGSVLQV